MAWSGTPRCSVTDCSQQGDRHVEWVEKVAGEFHLCEDHFREYRRRWPRQMVLKPKVKPDDRFSETPTVKTESQEAIQLEF